MNLRYTPLLINFAVHYIPMNYFIRRKFVTFNSFTHFAPQSLETTNIFRFYHNVFCLFVWSEFFFAILDSTQVIPCSVCSFCPNFSLTIKQSRSICAYQLFMAKLKGIASLFIHPLRIVINKKVVLVPNAYHSLFST